MALSALTILLSISLLSVPLLLHESPTHPQFSHPFNSERRFVGFLTFFNKFSYYISHRLYHQLLTATNCKVQRVEFSNSLLFIWLRIGRATILYEQKNHQGRCTIFLLTQLRNKSKHASKFIQNKVLCEIHYILQAFLGNHCNRF